MNAPLTLLPPPVFQDDDPLFEIIDGHRVETLPMSAYAVRLANRLAFLLNVIAFPKKMGEANVEVLFHLPLPVDRNRRPDLAYVSSQRWSWGKKQPLEDNAWNVVPELAGEVLSPNDLVEDLWEKIEEYFQAGILIVWVISPSLQKVYVYQSPTQVQVLGPDGILEGLPFLPDFRLPLAELFAEEADQP